jgi:hypothetical protein
MPFDQPTQAQTRPCWTGTTAAAPAAPAKHPSDQPGRLSAAGRQQRPNQQQQTRLSSVALREVSSEPLPCGDQAASSATVGNQQEHSSTPPELLQTQEQLLLAASRLAAAEWVEQQGAASRRPAASARSRVSKHAPLNKLARSRYQQLLQKATNRTPLQQQNQEDRHLPPSQQLQQQQQAGEHTRVKEKQKDKGPGMLMFRWSRRFSSGGASVDLQQGCPASSLPSCEQQASPRSSCRVSTTSTQLEQAGTGKWQTRRRADDGNGVAVAGYAAGYRARSAAVAAAAAASVAAVAAGLGGGGTAGETEERSTCKSFSFGGTV